MRTFEVNNVKCGGCAGSLKKSLLKDFGAVEVDLTTEPRKISLEIEEDRIEALKLKLKSMGYPLVSEQLKGIEKAVTNAKSYVSCAIGKMNQ